MLIVLAFNGSHWHGSSLHVNHSVENRMLVAVQAVEKWDVNRLGIQARALPEW